MNLSEAPRAFTKFRITTVSIIGSLQPLYSISFAMISLQEIPDLRTCVGGLIITAVVFETMKVNKIYTKPL